MENAPFDLVYYVWNQMLVGTIGKQSFCIPAVSGGGRGGVSAEKSFASYNPNRTTDESKGQRGGTIPPGLWRIKKPSEYSGKFKTITAKLTPSANIVSDFDMREYTKAPFLIHGPGGEGSNGCIVIDKIPRERLLNAVEEAGGAILLVTLQTRQGDLLDKAIRFRTTA